MAVSPTLSRGAAAGLAVAAALIPTLVPAAAGTALAAPAPAPTAAVAATVSSAATGGTVGTPSRTLRPTGVATIPLADGTARQTTGAPVPDLHDSGVRSTATFSLVGVSWTRGSSPDASFTVRTRSGGRWSAWSTLSTTDVGPDQGRTEDRSSARSATEPLWVGPSDGVQVRLVSASRRPTGVRVELVDPGTATGDAAFAAPATAAPAAAPAATAPAGTGTGTTSRTASVLVARTPGTVPAIISRAAWGADESLRNYNPNCTRPDYGTTVKMGFVHHTDNANNYAAGDVPGILRSIYAYHVKSNGWCDVGYNFLVDRFGRVFEGRYGGVSMPVIGAHTGGFNTDTFGTSLIGTFTSVTPPAVMMNALADLFAWKLGSYYRNPTGKTVLTAGVFSGSRFPAGTSVTFNTISGHRDADLTTCPGDRAYALLPSLRTMVAQRLPHSAIGARYAALGGPGGTLGEPILGGERAVPYGLITQFQRGSITYASATGARMLGAALTADYLAVGGPSGVLGFPIAHDEAPTGDGRGRYAQFQKGFIQYSAATGAHETHGLISSRYAALRFEAGPLGYPVTDERGVPDRVGRFNAFQNGFVYWSPTTGAHELYGPIATRWQALGYEAGVLGYPTAAPAATADGTGQSQQFQRGVIYNGPVTGAHAVRGAIRDRYVAEGGQAGPLGYPTSDERTVAPGVVQTDFEHGSISWTLATGATTVTMH